MNQIKTWNSITAITVITDTTAITWNSITVKAWNSRTDTTVITAITPTTCNRATAKQQITWNGITAKQLSQIKQDNSKILFLQVWSNINGRMGNEQDYTHYQDSMRCL